MIDGARVQYKIITIIIYIYIIFKNWNVLFIVGIFLLKKRYFVLIDTMLEISISNKWETCLQKITTSLIIERHILVDIYFCIHVFRLLDFDMNDGVLFDTKCFFLGEPHQLGFSLLQFILSIRSTSVRSVHFYHLGLIWSIWSTLFYSVIFNESWNILHMDFRLFIAHHWLTFPH